MWSNKKVSATVRINENDQEPIGKSTDFVFYQTVAGRTVFKN